jgi:hypothetical protein
MTKTKAKTVLVLVLVAPSIWTSLARFRPRWVKLLTPVAEPKESVPVVVKEEAKKLEPIDKKEGGADVPITGPVSIKGPVLNNAKKEKGKETAKPVPHFDDPIPRQVTIPAHPKPSFWDALCCRSTAAVASYLMTTVRYCNTIR